jgi:hypothetical protein
VGTGAALVVRVESRKINRSRHTREVATSVRWFEAAILCGGGACLFLAKTPSPDLTRLPWLLTVGALLAIAACFAIVAFVVAKQLKTERT